MQFQEIELVYNDITYKTAIHSPDNPFNKTGIILAHGGFVNRCSLARKKDSLSSYLCKKLDAIVFTPDLPCLNPCYSHPFSISSEIINNTIKILAEQYNLNSVHGFGHSVGCYSLAQAVSSSKIIDSLVLFGGPIGYHNKNMNKLLVKTMNLIMRLKKSVNTSRFLKYAYSKETVDYLFNDMMSDEVFEFTEYYFDFDLRKVYEVGVFLDDYVSCLKSFRKAVLLLFGGSDKICTFSRELFFDGYRDGNILVNHLEEVSHITPCKKNDQLNKLSIIVDFFKEHFDNPDNLLMPNEIYATR